MDTTITVPRGLRDRLMIRKVETGAKTLADVIEVLLDGSA